MEEAEGGWVVVKGGCRDGTVVSVVVVRVCGGVV